MKLTKIDSPGIDRQSVCRVKVCGNVTEIMSSDKRSKGGYIRKLDSETFVDVRTGVVGKFHHIENRSQDLHNVQKSLSHGRDILNTNITDVTRCRWVTLTYAENMTDPKKLVKDFGNFNSRLRSVVGSYEYITAAEPQGRGAWHLHVVMIFPGKAPFIPNETISNAWKQGFVTVKKLDDVDNVGAYLTAYLGDMDVDDPSALYEITPGQSLHIKETEIIDENGEKICKRYIKGARLHMYPPGFHIFRWSKGIKMPTITTETYESAKKKVSAATLTYSKAVVLSDPEKEYENTLVYEYYNSVRSQCQE